MNWKETNANRPRAHAKLCETLSRRLRSAFVPDLRSRIGARASDSCTEASSGSARARARARARIRLRRVKACQPKYMRQFLDFHPASAELGVLAGLAVS